LPARDGKTVVIDGNAAVNAAIVVGAFAGWSHVHLCAPTLIWSEAASGISQMHWRREITDAQASAAIERLLDAPLELFPSRDLVTEAAALAHQLGWAKTYDAEYVVLARRLGAPLMTVDARLGASASRHVEVVSPADVESWLLPKKQTT
jgi:predicted nucleic acid-binding protein